MKRKFAKLGLVTLAIVVVAALLSALSMSSASADEPTKTVASAPDAAVPELNKAAVMAQRSNDCETTSETQDTVDYTFTTCVSASSKTKVKSVASGKAKVDSRGRLILSYIMPNGLPAWKQNHCDRIPAGKSYVNNFYDSTGKEQWVRKTAGSGGVKICQNGKVWRVVKCGNKVFWKKIPPKVRKAIFKGKWVEKRRQKYWAEAKARAEGKSVSSVVAVQATGPCAGSRATADASGSFVAFARARAWGWSKREALINVQGAADQLNIEQEAQDRAKVSARAIARGNAMTKVDAKIVCNQPDQPEEPEQPPSFLQFREFNDLEVNWTSDHCVTVSFPSGHSGTVSWTAQYGSFATPSKPASSGTQVCSTYKAPSEVPGSGHDTITVTATDSTTGKTVTKTTAPFVIHPNADHPL